MKATLIFAITLALIGSSLAEKVVSCYYGSWANYRQGNGACKVEHLNPFMCTHLIYGFVGLNDDDGSIRIMDPWLELPDDWGKDNFGQFNKLKQVNTKLKTIIAIGGWNEGSARYSKVASDPVLRGNFVRNAAEFTVKYGFDGFDLDWEYPGQRDTVNDAEDIRNHALLIQEMRDEFDKHGLLLTAAVAAVRKSAELSYDFQTLGRVLDYVHVMVYDMWGAWETTTGHNAALHKYQPQIPDPDSFDVETAVNFWLSTGVPREKIIMGMPLYGRSFSLASADNNGIGAPATGAGVAGQYSGERGMLGLNEFCEKRQSESWNEIWDSVGEVPYAFRDTDWVTFDNFDSLTKKTQLAMEKDLGGVFVWSIETDDFMGLCNPQKFPYLRTINAVIGRVIDETTTSTTEDPNSPTTSSSTSTTGGGGGTDPSGICTKPGYVRDPNNCAVFYNCLQEANGDYTVFRFECAPGLAFDDIRNVCDYADQVQC